MKDDFVNPAGIKNYPAYEIMDLPYNKDLISINKTYHMSSGHKYIEERLVISKEDFEKMLNNYRNT